MWSFPAVRGTSSKTRPESGSGSSTRRGANSRVRRSWSTRPGSSRTGPSSRRARSSPADFNERVDNDSLGRLRSRLRGGLFHPWHPVHAAARAERHPWLRPGRGQGPGGSLQDESRWEREDLYLLSHEEKATLIWPDRPRRWPPARALRGPAQGTPKSPARKRARPGQSERILRRHRPGRKVDLLKARGMTLKKWDIGRLRAWGKPVPMKTLKLKRKSGLRPPQRTNITPGKETPSRRIRLRPPEGYRSSDSSSSRTCPSITISSSMMRSGSRSGPRRRNLGKRWSISRASAGISDCRSRRSCADLKRQFTEISDHLQVRKKTLKSYIRAISRRPPDDHHPTNSITYNPYYILNKYLLKYT